MAQRIDVGALTDVGRRRAANQDAFLAERGVYVVCDGMGGEEGGERASAIAVEEFARLAQPGERSRASIDATVQRAQRRARALGEQLGGIAGTTVTGVVLRHWDDDGADRPTRSDAARMHGRHAHAPNAPRGVHAAVHVGIPASASALDDWDITQPGASGASDASGVQEPAGDDAASAWEAACGCLMPRPAPSCYIVNIGDSRTYHMARIGAGLPGAGTWDAGSLTQITHDHSSRQQAIDDGMMSEREAERLIARNVITRCIGAPAGTQADVFAAQAQGRFIICSDGCHGELDDATIATIAAVHDDAPGAARALVQASLDAGGSDNVTVVVVDMPAGSESPMAWAGARLEDDEDLGDIDDVTVQT